MHLTGCGAGVVRGLTPPMFAVTSYGLGRLLHVAGDLPRGRTLLLDDRNDGNAGVACRGS